MSKYIGKRIVPKHCGKWNASASYEGLSIVYNDSTGDSYISRKEVPVGTELTDTEYWALCSQFSSQVKEIRDGLSDAEKDINLLDTRFDNLVTASTDENADYAAEVVDARVDNAGEIHGSLGDAVRSVGDALDAHVLIDYPFEYGTDYTRAIDGRSTIERGAIRYFHVSMKKETVLPLRLGPIYSYGNNMLRMVSVLNYSGSTLWSYKEDYTDGTVPEYPVQTLEIDCDYMEGTIIVDWSKVAHSLPISISTDFICFLGTCVDKETLISNQIDTLTEKLEIQGAYENRYPFTYDSDLTRVNYPTHFWYTQRGIFHLRVPVYDNQEYFVYNLYSNHSTHHFALFEIRSADMKTAYYQIKEQWELDENGKAIIPDEEKTYKLTDTKTGQQIEDSCVIINWAKVNSAYGVNLSIENSRLLEECLIREHIKEEEEPVNYVEWAAPSDYYVLVNRQQRMFFDEIANTNVYGYFYVSSTLSYPQVTCTDEYVEFNVTSAADFTVTIILRDFYNHDISSMKINIHAIAELDEYPERKIMFLGDSLTAAGTMQNTFRDMVGNNCVLYGTMGSGVYLHEGRSSWSSSNYVNDASKNSVENAFYNPETETFDFSYYVQQHPGFADVEIINIFLGRNDGYGTKVITNLETIIGSIHEYNPDIIITLMCAYNVAADNSGCGKYLQSSHGYNFTGKEFNIKFRDAFDGREDEKIYIIPQHLNLDSAYDYARAQKTISNRHTETRTVYTNNVHPDTTGYQHFADVYLAYYNFILQG